MDITPNYLKKHRQNLAKIVRSDALEKITPESLNKHRQNLAKIVRSDALLKIPPYSLNKHRQYLAKIVRSDALLKITPDLMPKLPRVRWCTDVWDTILSFTRIRRTGLDHYRSLYDASCDYCMYRYHEIHCYIREYYGESSVINAPDNSQLRVLVNSFELLHNHRRPKKNIVQPILSNILKLYQKASHLEYMVIQKRWMTVGSAIAKEHATCLPIDDISSIMNPLLSHVLTARCKGGWNRHLGYQELQRIVGLHGIELMNNSNIADNHADKSSTLRDSLQRYVEYIELLI
jgi:hypothetical protein